MRILLRKSTTPGNKPSSLLNGELAINAFDGKIFVSQTSGSATVEEVFVTNTDVTGSLALHSRAGSANNIVSFYSESVLVYSIDKDGVARYTDGTFNIFTVDRNDQYVLVDPVSRFITAPSGSAGDTGERFWLKGNVKIDTNGYIILPIGGDAQRPSTPTEGYFRYNSGSKYPEFYNGTGWVALTTSSTFTESDPIFVTSDAYGITGTQTASWDEAYSWGDHALVGYLTALPAHTHSAADITSGIFDIARIPDIPWSKVTSTPTTLSGYGILNAYTQTQVDNIFNGTTPKTGYNNSNWDTAYSWGDHSLEGYLTEETDPHFSSSIAFGITGTQTASWDTAYGWGDHSTAGYALAANVYTIAEIDAAGDYSFLNLNSNTGVRVRKLRADGGYDFFNFVTESGDLHTWSFSGASLNVHIPYKTTIDTGSISNAHYLTEQAVYNWVSSSFVEEAPIDGNEYVRKNGQWSVATTGSGSGTTFLSLSDTFGSYSGRNGQVLYVSGSTINSQDLDLVYAQLIHTHSAADVTSGIFDVARIPDLNWSKITSTPTTLAGYGITDAQPLDTLLTNLSALAGPGILAHNGSGTAYSRTLTGTAPISVTNGTGVSGNPTISHASSGVVAGTYQKVVVDARGHVTSGSNPSTLAGFGITDVYTKNEIEDFFAGNVAITGYNKTNWDTAYSERGSQIAGAYLNWNGTSLDVLRTVNYFELSGSTLVNTSSIRIADDYDATVLLNKMTVFNGGGDNGGPGGATFGTYDMFIGEEAGGGTYTSSITPYSVNTFLGYAAGKDSDTTYTTAVGGGAGRNTKMFAGNYTTSSLAVGLASATYIGASAGRDINWASFDTLIGGGAGRYLSQSFRNVAVGNAALSQETYSQSLLRVQRSVFVGSGAGQGLNRDVRNVVALGFESHLWGGSNESIFIGTYSGFRHPSVLGLDVDNVIQIGHQYNTANTLPLNQFRDNISDAISIGNGVVPTQAYSITWPTNYDMALGHSNPISKFDIIGTGSISEGANILSVGTTTSSLGLIVSSSLDVVLPQKVNGTFLSTDSTGAIYTSSIASLDLATQTWVGANYAASSHTHPWSDITSTPTSLTGYGIVDAYTTSSLYTKTELQTSGQSAIHWDNLTDTPIYLSGYSIVDAYTTGSLQTSGQAQVHWDNITNTPVSVAGYGILDVYTTGSLYTTSSLYTKTELQTSGQSSVHWGNITNTPTTISGYGITDAYTKTELNTSSSAQVHWDNVVSTPTTLSGYGITDGVSNSTDTYTGSAAIQNIVSLSQAEYDAIGTKDSNTLYVIV